MKMVRSQSNCRQLARRVIDLATFPLITSGCGSVPSRQLNATLPDMAPSYTSEVFEYGVDLARPLRVPSLHIVIFIVGSRGDVQPYLAVALYLIKTYEHTVRIATHDVFEGFVLEQSVHLRGLKTRDGKSLEDNLEFFGVGGDPKELMSYMVKREWASHEDISR